MHSAAIRYWFMLLCSFCVKVAFSTAYDCPGAFLAALKDSFSGFIAVSQWKYFMCFHILYTEKPSSCCSSPVVTE